MNEQPLVVLSGHGPKTPDNDGVWVNEEGAVLLRDALNRLIETGFRKWDKVVVEGITSNGHTRTLTVHVAKQEDFDCGGGS